MYKKIFIVLVSLSLLSNLFSKDTALIGKWIDNWDQEKFDQIGYKISNVKEQDNEMLEFGIAKKHASLKIVINSKLEFNDLSQTISAVEKAFNLGEMYIDNRGYGKVLINKAEIVFGSTDLVLVLPEIEKLILTWNIEKKLSLDITKKISKETTFRYDIKKHDFVYTINYINKISVDTGINDKFQGWNFYLEKLFFSLDAAIKDNDPEATEFIRSALINVDNLKFSSKRQESEFFYISIEEQETANISKKQSSGLSYYEARIDSKILTSFSIRNLGSPRWAYRPFGLKIINGIYADVNVTSLTYFSGLTVFDILKTGLSLGFGLSVGIPALKKDENNKYILATTITVFTIETIFNINLINDIYKGEINPLTVDVLFCFDLFPGYISYFKFLMGLSTDGKDTGFVIGGRLVFDINLPQAKLKRDFNTIY